MEPAKFLAALAISTSLAAPALAADNAATPLPAGKPAGVKQAAFGVPTLPFLIIAGSLIFAAVAGAGGFSSSSTSGTSS